MSLEKAQSFPDRFREIISDPINIFIERVADAGYVDKNNCVILHNGNRVPLAGDFAYYEGFSDILIFNRGVHEPLEEYCFQEMLKKIKIKSPIIIELGAYWAHYSMWVKKKFPEAKCYMIEPELKNLECGKNNFRINNFDGKFINDSIQNSETGGGFQLDVFASKKKLTSINIFHCDIQGYEVPMLQGTKFIFENQIVDYAFISTHSEAIHKWVIKEFEKFKYKIEVSSGFDNHTTSYDGFVLASSPKSDSIFKSFLPLGRIEILRSSPKELIEYIKSISI
jgi:hypothetical protein